MLRKTDHDLILILLVDITLNMISKEAMKLMKNLEY